MFRISPRLKKNKKKTSFRYFPVPNLKCISSVIEIKIEKGIKTSKPFLSFGTFLSNSNKQKLNLVMVIVSNKK